jgi:hypothetical protein
VNRTSRDSDFAGDPDQRSPLLAPFAVGGNHVSSQPFALGNDHNPDSPLPSVEIDSFATDSRQDPPSTTSETPLSIHDGPVVECLEDNALSSSLQALRLQTPVELANTPSQEQQTVQSKRVMSDFRQTSVTSPSRDNTSTPSVQLTPAPSTNDISQGKHLSQPHSEGITEGLDALRLRSPSLTESPAHSRARQDHSLTPSRRRRSSSAIDKAPYRVEDEQPPTAFSQMREVQQVFDKTRKISENIANVLSSSDLHQEPDSTIKNLYREALRLSKFELPSSRTVGLVGDSGVGKSSLINSLLDKEDLARSVSGDVSVFAPTNITKQNNNGSACTCVATEYHYHERDDYAVEAEIFSMDDLKKQYEDMLRVYQQAQSPPAEIQGDELANLRRRAKIAEDTFEASFEGRFKQRPGLLTLPVNQAVETMLQWASQLLPQHRADQTSRISEIYSDIATCSVRIRELTSEVREMETLGPKIPWPFVRKLRYVRPLSGKDKTMLSQDHDLTLGLYRNGTLY